MFILILQLECRVRENRPEIASPSSFFNLAPIVIPKCIRPLYSEFLGGFLATVLNYKPYIK